MAGDLASYALAQHTTAFAPDYVTARQRFQDAARRRGWSLETHPVDGRGPADEPLTVDVAWSPQGDPARVLVVTAGLHGVEGYFGSAVQVGWLEQRAVTASPPVKCVFVHALNPWGFAWGRRCDARNVDLNRSFLLPGEPFSGAPPLYRQLDHLLNPPRPPAVCDLFLVQALRTLARHGLPALRQAIAAGQFEFPTGLFFGGREPSSLTSWLDEQLPRWLAGSRWVVHLDLHTGLGSWGRGKLLLDYPLTDTQRNWFTDWLGAQAWSDQASRELAYEARGSWGRWFHMRQFAPQYLYACAEFGTYGPLAVLAGLRAENQAWHWGDPAARSGCRARQRLRELFCPRSPRWRASVLAGGLRLLELAQHGLSELR